MLNFKKNDLITGYYGYSNFGDDLFCDILYSALSKSDSLNPKVIKNDSSKSRLFFKGIDIFSNLLNARSITLGGGSILGLNSKASRRGIEYAFSKASIVSYNAIGVGLLNPQKKIPENFINAMDYVGLRSIREFELLSKTFSNVHYTADIAYSLKKYLHYDSISPSSSSKYVGIILTDVGFIGSRSNADMLDFVKSVLNSFHSSTIFNIYNFQRNRLEDRIAINKLISCLKSINADFNYIEHENTLETISSLSNNEFIISDRLHGAILSHILDIPFILSNHHTKCLDFLLDIGHPFIPQEGYVLSPQIVENLKYSSETLRSSKKEFENTSISSIEDWKASLI